MFICLMVAVVKYTWITVMPCTNENEEGTYEKKPLSDYWRICTMTILLYTMAARYYCIEQPRSMV